MTFPKIWWSEQNNAVCIPRMSSKVEPIICGDRQCEIGDDYLNTAECDQQHMSSSLHIALLSSFVCICQWQGRGQYQLSNTSSRTTPHAL